MPISVCVLVHAEIWLVACNVCTCVRACVCVREVLAVTWHTGQGVAARGLLIIMGGAACKRERERRETACMGKGRKIEMKRRWGESDVDKSAAEKFHFFPLKEEISQK